jgi:hypothetical protein
MKNSFRPDNFIRRRIQSATRRARFAGQKIASAGQLIASALAG